MTYRIAVVLGLAVLPAIAGDWNPRLAAEYLDERQKEWFAWPAANNGAKPCISCHTGVPYLLGRPALRKVLGEKEPTEYEKGLLESLRSRLDKKEPNGASLGVESVMAATFLRTPAAYDRMWGLQSREGDTAGGFKWFNLDLDPWEEPEAQLFGASLAAIAVNGAPAEYRQQPEVRERMTALMEFLNRPREGQPLHNRLAVAWASNDEKLRAKVTTEVFGKQSADGGWSMESLGPWHTHANAPPPKDGSNTYATAFTSVVLMKTGTRSSDTRLERALAWLRTHQSEHGYFYAESMNKQYKPDSMEIKFMRDAATGWASLALVEAMGK
jgi:squalene-hopene/tetraprenyl-beta-curcumene cyclase